MKRLGYLAVLMMLSSSAHAGTFSFVVHGHRVRVERPSHCFSRSCLSVTLPGLHGTHEGDRVDDIAAASDASPAKPAPAPVATTPPPAPVVEASTAPRPLLHDVTPSTSSLAPPPAPVGASTAPAPAADAQPAVVADAPATPLGLWATQDNKGNVQIEQCGQNLCGFAEKSREPILINMKPQNNKWTGRIHDPDGGSNYDSTIALKGPNILKVQGCAFGGLFCGGQTWKRIS